MYNPEINKVTEYALMIADTFNVFVEDKKNLTPNVNSGSFINKNWIVDGYLYANDCLLRDIVDIHNDNTFYGYIVHAKDNPKEFVTIIRGTGTALEWLNNIKAYKSNITNGVGKVEDGFYDIYKTMKFINIGDSIDKSMDVTDKIKSLMKNGSEMTIIGHSLGAALGTYLTYDVAKEIQLDGDTTDNLKMCSFASPKTGNKEYVNDFHDSVKNYVVYNYSKDVVPDTPFTFFGYSSLKNIKEITPDTSQAIIKGDLLSNHHVVCYAAMLNYGFTDNWTELLIKNHDEPDAIVGRNDKVFGIEKPKEFEFNISDIWKNITKLRDSVKESVSVNNNNVIG